MEILFGFCLELANILYLCVNSLRGAKGTNQAVREFWMLCRGTNLSFVS